MGQKINPILYRVGINRDFESIWFAERDEYVNHLMEDLRVRKYVKNRLKNAMVSHVLISRKTNSINIDIHTNRPGLVIGKKGAEIENLRREITMLLNKDREQKLNIFINIHEIKHPWLDAHLVGGEISRQLSERVSYRRAMKMAMRNALKEGAKGIKVQVSGRLAGAEIARTERYKEGRTPLHTLRANIDYALVECHTTYGVIGIKVWIYKGDIL